EAYQIASSGHFRRWSRSQRHPLYRASLQVVAEDHRALSGAAFRPCVQSGAGRLERAEPPLLRGPLRLPFPEEPSVIAVAEPDDALRPRISQPRQVSRRAGQESRRAVLRGAVRTQLQDAGDPTGPVGIPTHKVPPVDIAADLLDQREQGALLLRHAADPYPLPLVCRGGRSGQRFTLQAEKG